MFLPETAWRKTGNNNTTYLDMGIVPVSGTAARSVVFSFKNNQLDQTRRMGGWGNSGPDGFRWRLDNINDFAFRVETGSGNARGTTTTGLDDDLWHKVAFGVGDSADIDDLQMVVDGILQAITSSSSTIDTGTDNDLSIGIDQSETTNGPPCAYQELAVYDRLLTATEMEQLTVPHGRTPEWIPEGRIVYFPLRGHSPFFDFDVADRQAVQFNETFVEISTDVPNVIRPLHLQLLRVGGLEAAAFAGVVARYRHVTYGIPNFRQDMGPR